MCSLLFHCDPCTGLFHARYINVKRSPPPQSAILASLSLAEPPHVAFSQITSGEAETPPYLALTCILVLITRSFSIDRGCTDAGPDLRGCANLMRGMYRAWGGSARPVSYEHTC
jgi:hypothetical protein